MKPDLTRCLAGTCIIAIIIFGVLCSIFLVRNGNRELVLGDLKQVHVIFTHGERTPTYEETQLFPLSVNFDEAYYPYGLNALTNEGKLKMYNLGTKLKDIYGEFLGEKYEPTNYIMQTIESDVSKMSALLVTMGMWPMETDEMWNVDTWQPIPYKTVKQNSDFLQYETNCPRFEVERKKVLDEYMAHNDLPYPQLFALIDLYTGANVTEFSQVVKLAHFMEAQKPFTNSTPKWYKSLESIINKVLITYNKLSYQKSWMKEIATGYLFKKVYTDSKQVMHNEELENKVVLYGYSANLNNMAGLLADTNLKHKLPKLGSAFIVELYSIVSDYEEYVYKFFYYDVGTNALTGVKLNKCDEPCSMHSFKNMIAKPLHKDYKIECS